MLRRLASLLLASLLVGACVAAGSSSAPTSPTRSPPTSSLVATTEVTDPGDDSTPAASGGDELEPGSSGVLRLAMVGAPVWDPLAASPVDPAAMTVLDLVYDGLTRWVHPDSGDDGPGRWVPALADSITSDDQRVWRIVLGDHRFSDGERVEAADVARSLVRLIRDGSTLGGARLADVTGIVGIGWNELRVTLAAPDARFPARLSHPLFGIVPEGPVDGRVSSGPMVRSSQDPFRLEPAEAASPDAVVGASLEAIRLLTFTTPSEAAAAVQAGDADLVHVDASVPMASMVLTGTDVLVRDSTVQVFFVSNAASPALGSIEIREDVVEAAEPTALHAALTAAPAAGESTPPTDLAQVDDTGDEPTSSPSPEPPSPDPDDGVVEVAHVLDEPGGETAMAREFVAQLERAGVAAEAVGYPLDDLVRLIAEGRHEIVRSGWVGLFPGDDGTPELVASRSPDNITGVSDPGVDDLVDAALASADGGTGADLAAAVEGLAVLVPVGAVELRAVVADRVEGLILLGDGTLDLSSVVLRPY